jgi:hypothetical protein
MATAMMSQTVEANDDLNNMLEVRTSDGNTPNEASDMINRLENIDDRILYEANRSGAHIILMDSPLTDLPEFQHLSGKVPKGWEGTGNTWEDVPGAGGYTTAARIGYSDPGNGHSTINLELHEFGHAVDSYVAGFTISDSEEFRNVMSKEKDALFGDHEVSEYFDTPSEYFAEVFGMYYLGGDAREKLQTRAPETYRFISTLHNRLISFSEITGNTMTITWDDVEGTSSYNVYQNGEKVDEVDSGVEEYTAEDLDVSTTYEFYIEPEDQDGNRLYTSYYRYASTNAEEDPGQIDTEELEATLNKAKDLSAETEDGDLNTLVEEAETLLEDESSDDVEQADVNDLNDSLLSAIDRAEAEKEEDAEAESDEADDSNDQENEDDSSGEATDEEASSEDDSSQSNGGNDSEDNESADSDTDASDEESVGSDTEGQSIQNEDTGSNTVWIVTAIVLVVLAILSSIFLVLRRR